MPTNNELLTALLNRNKLVPTPNFALDALELLRKKNNALGKEASPLTEDHEGRPLLFCLAKHNKEGSMTPYMKILIHVYLKDYPISKNTDNKKITVSGVTHSVWFGIDDQTINWLLDEKIIPSQDLLSHLLQNNQTGEHTDLITRLTTEYPKFNKTSINDGLKAELAKLFSGDYKSVDISKFNARNVQYFLSIGANPDTRLDDGYNFSVNLLHLSVSKLCYLYQNTELDKDHQEKTFLKDFFLELINKYKLDVKARTKKCAKAISRHSSIFDIAQSYYRTEVIELLMPYDPDRTMINAKTATLLQQPLTPTNIEEIMTLVEKGASANTMVGSSNLPFILHLALNNINNCYDNLIQTLFIKYDGELDSTKKYLDAEKKSLWTRMPLQALQHLLVIGLRPTYELLYELIRNNKDSRYNGLIIALLTDLIKTNAKPPVSPLQVALHNVLGYTDHLAYKFDKHLAANFKQLNLDLINRLLDMGESPNLQLSPRNPIPLLHMCVIHLNLLTEPNDHAEIIKCKNLIKRLICDFCVNTAVLTGICPDNPTYSHLRLSQLATKPHVLVFLERLGLDVVYESQLHTFILDPNILPEDIMRLVQVHKLDMEACDENQLTPLALLLSQPTYRKEIAITLLFLGAELSSATEPNYSLLNKLVKKQPHNSEATTKLNELLKASREINFIAAITLILEGADPTTFNRNGETVKSLLTSQNKLKKFDKLLTLLNYHLELNTLVQIDSERTSQLSTSHPPTQTASSTTLTGITTSNEASNSTEATASTVAATSVEITSSTGATTTFTTGTQQPLYPNLWQEQARTRNALNDNTVKAIQSSSVSSGKTS